MLQTLILDEADEMLNMGFIEDIEAILTDVPAEASNIIILSYNAWTNSKNC